VTEPRDPDAARPKVREMARASIQRGDPLGWFERLYAQAHGNAAEIPWGDQVPNPNLIEWLGNNRVAGGGRTAAVVGCGLGDDAEALAAAGFAVTGFDLAPSAITWCRRRFSDSPVVYQVADLLHPPAAWGPGFDFVYEGYTLQAVPPDVRQAMLAPLAGLVRPGGSLLIVARGREEADPKGDLPWPLTRAELDPLLAAGLTVVRFEDYLDREDPPKRRFRIEYRKNG